MLNPAASVGNSEESVKLVNANPGGIDGTDAARPILGKAS